jgi:hypothetical protein
MNIKGTPTISAHKLPANKWQMTVKYNLEFTPEEVNPPPDYEFRHGFRIVESDIAPDTDDLVAAWKAFNLWNPPPVVHVSETIEVSNGALDTEHGDEEIRAQVLVRNLTTGGNPKTKYSDILQLA